MHDVTKENVQCSKCLGLSIFVVVEEKANNFFLIKPTLQRQHGLSYLSYLALRIIYDEEVIILK